MTDPAGVIIIPIPYTHSDANQPMTWWLWLIVGITIAICIGICTWICHEIWSDMREDRRRR